MATEKNTKYQYSRKMLADQLFALQERVNDILDNGGTLLDLNETLGSISDDMDALYSDIFAKGQGS